MTGACSTFTAKIWFPQGAGENTSIATLTVDSGEPALFNVASDHPTEMTVAIKANPNDTVTFRLFCNHRIANAGEEKRQLSFVLMGLSCTQAVQ